MSKCTDRKTAVAVAAHPDDIEFMMAGTLLRLKNAGYEIHYFNISNGCLGTEEFDYETIVGMRRREAMAAAGLAGAVYHESLCDDFEVFYNFELLSQMVEIMRGIAPEIVLTHGPYDYMEDHINAGRLAVSAVFCRGMKNFKCARKYPPANHNAAVYHSMPHSLLDQLNRPVTPDFYVDITPVAPLKRQMLACHKSQKEWLDASQGNDAYLDDMESRGRHFGKLSGKYQFAEGWIRHNPVGFGPAGFDPLKSLT